MARRPSINRHRSPCDARDFSGGVPIGSCRASNPSMDRWLRDTNQFGEAALREIAIAEVVDKLFHAARYTQDVYCSQYAARIKYTHAGCRLFAAVCSRLAP